ncbi:hypothetical protein [Alicyclobacillus mengziensis]|nr:hypothetical protein [Alicyclobacillus mengziensis]
MMQNGSNGTFPFHPDDAATNHSSTKEDSSTMAELADGFQRLVAELKMKYEVQDILLPSSTLVFILESPHVQELEFGAPVSGTSGMTMTRHLFGPDYARFALGRLVKKNADEGKNRPRLNRIGLINVSNIPLQASAYQNKELIQQHKRWFDAMAIVRSENHRDTYPNPYCQAVQSVLVASLREKLRCLREDHLTIVPCGRFAQKFFRLTGQDCPNWSVINEVPHPSYNSWDRPRYRDAVDAVCAALNNGSDV